MERLLDFSSDDPGKQWKSRCQILSCRLAAACVEIFVIKTSSAAHTHAAELVSGATLKVRSEEKSSLHFWSE